MDSISICIIFAVFAGSHQPIFFENFAKIIYVAVADKLGDFNERIIGVEQQCRRLFYSFGVDVGREVQVHILFE